MGDTTHYCAVSIVVCRPRYKYNPRMATWRKALSKIGGKADDTFDSLRHSFEQRLGLKREVYVRTYDWFGTESKITVRGRALRVNGLRSAEDADGLWDNLLNSYIYCF